MTKKKIVVDMGNKEVYTSDSIMLFGYPLFGGILPFIGFREFTLSPEEVYEYAGVEVDEPIKYNPFVLEWFQCGLSFGGFKVPLKDQDIDPFA